MPLKSTKLVNSCYTVCMPTDLNVTYLITVIASLLISLGIHEAMHAFTAFRLGDDTAAEEGRLTLNPLKHLDIYMTILLPAVMILFGLPPIFAAKPVPFDPTRVRFEEFGAALVAIAGPLSNLGLAVLGAVLVKLGVLAGLLEPALIFIWVNLGLFVFNMLPIPPLDGSRLLYAFAPAPLQRVMEQIEAVGLLVVLVVVLLFSSVVGPVIFNIVHAIADFLLPQYF